MCELNKSPGPSCVFNYNPNPNPPQSPSLTIAPPNYQNDFPASLRQTHSATVDLSTPHTAGAVEGILLAIT